MMTPQEWWWIYDAKIGEPHYGSLRESEIDELYEDMKRGSFNG